MLRKTRVYVAGPYTKGDVAVNVREAIVAANRLADQGYLPFVPHLTHFWHLLYPRPYEFWVQMDLAFLPYCDALLRLPGESSGADGEVVAMAELGKPVFHDERALYAKLPPEIEDKDTRGGRTPA